MISQNMLDALMNNTSRLIYFKDLEGRYTFINPVWQRHAGVPADQVLGRTDIEIFGTEWGNCFRRNDLKVLAERDTCDFEESVTLNGATITYHSIKFPVFDDDGALSGIGGISADITERKQLEQSLRLSNRTKDKFFSIIAHDLKNPLNGLLGLTELLLDEHPASGTARIGKELRLINQTTKVLHNLLDNLLTWSRSQTGLLEYTPMALPLCALVEECIQLAQPALHAKQLRLELHCEQEMEITADPHMTATILRNLLANAIKYSWPEGVIYIAGWMLDGFACVEVRDEGVGIPAARLERLFSLEDKASSPGTQGEQGSGLGLLLCKDFAERQHGRIEVESECGRGTRLRVLIPGRPLTAAPGQR